MAKPWEQTASALNTTAAPEEFISSNVAPEQAGQSIPPNAPNPMLPDPTSALTSAAGAASSVLQGTAAQAAKSLTGTGSTLANAASTAASSASGLLGGAGLGGTGLGGTGLGGAGLGGTGLGTGGIGGSMYGSSPYSRFGSYGGLGGMGGYGSSMLGMGRMSTGNQMMDQMNQYVMGISEMAGMVEHNAGGLAKFILLLKKMGIGVWNQGKEVAIAGYQKALVFLAYLRKMLMEKLDLIKEKIGYGATGDVPSLAFFPAERLKIEEQKREQLEKKIKFLDKCVWVLLGLVAFNVGRIFINELKKIA